MLDTTFSNQLILLEDIPAIETADFQSLERSYLTVKRITFSIFLMAIFVGVGAIFYFNEPLQLWWAILAVYSGLLVVAALYLVADTLSFRYSGYALREHDLMYRSGWWWRVLRIVPFNRVQHLSIESGLIERQFNLSSIHIYTAGASQADFTLRGIKSEVAEKLKDWITLKIQDKENTKDQELDNQPNDQPHE